ncbi:MAG: hypothetical protein ABIP51_02285 [Bacteroidia bacterium]
MLFDQKEFEHKIEEEKLKKGLKLFVKNKVELLNKTAQSEFNFLVDDTVAIEIFIRKKGEKILNYTCSCNNKNYCEHFAAALFYLEERSLEFSKKQISQQKRNKITKGQKSEFGNYFQKIKEIIKPFLVSQKLNQKELQEIGKNINFERTKASTFNEEFYFDLALILQIPQLINLNTGKEEELIIGLKNSTENLEKACRRGLSAKEKAGWILAAHYSLRSQSYFRANVFYFLISKAIPFLKDKNEIQQLLNSLKKRKENKNSLSSISKKLIIEIELSIVLASISGKAYSYKKVESRLELPIALSELEFVKKRPAKGFKILEQYADKIKIKNINQYLDLIDHVLFKAKEEKNCQIEKHYLAEKFIYGYYIDQKELNYYFEQMINDNREDEASQLVKSIKERSVFYNFDKIADILFYQERLDELVNEIKKEKNKFTLLNKIAFKKFPNQNEVFLQLYVKHLCQAIAEAKFPYFQEEVFNKAKPYLDLLPKEEKESMIKNLKEKMLYERQMLKYIEKIYPAI